MVCSCSILQRLPVHSHVSSHTQTRPVLKFTDLQRRHRLTACQRRTIQTRAETSADVVPIPSSSPDQEYERVWKPKYNKYRSQSDLERDNIKKWKDIMGYQYIMGSPSASPLSIVLYALNFIKYNIVPRFLRYTLYAVLQAAKRKYHTFHRAMVIRGAKLDVRLQEVGSRGTEQPGFSRAEVMRRYHYKQTPFDLVAYRYMLIRERIPPLLRL